MLRNYILLKYTLFINKVKLIIFGKKYCINKQFMKEKGYSLNWNKLETFNEKLQGRKIENTSLFSKHADKLLVREYIAKTIGSKYLIPILFVTEKLKLKDWENLPESFVLKTNNACSTNIFVYNKNEVNKLMITRKINKYKNIKFGYLWYELFYNDIKSMVFVERMLLDNGKIPLDYKFHCFKDNIFIQVDYDRYGNHIRNFYDKNWEFIPIENNYKNDKSLNIKKPDKLEEMICIVNKLSQPFNYVRIDLYYLNNKIYFGEMTFTHAAGFSKFNPTKYDKIWGGMM